MSTFRYEPKDGLFPSTDAFVIPVSCDGDVRDVPINLEGWIEAFQHSCNPPTVDGVVRHEDQLNQVSVGTVWKWYFGDGRILYCLPTKYRILDPILWEDVVACVDDLVLNIKEDKIKSICIPVLATVRNSLSQIRPGIVRLEHTKELLEDKLKDINGLEVVLYGYDQ